MTAYSHSRPRADGNPHRFLRVFVTRIRFGRPLAFFPAFAFFSTRSFHAARNAPSSTSSLAAPSPMCVLRILGF